MDCWESEAALVELLVDLLKAGDSPWGDVNVLQEFFYARGKTDVVVTTDDALIAIEAKLFDWRRALDQAYRNTCFAQQSYVLLPERKASLAMKHNKEFEMRNVGICCIVDGQLQILFSPADCDPVEPWLTAKARQLATV